MTVSTNDVAFRHLCQDALPVPISQPLSDAESLARDVVELKDQRITFAAVDARIRSEEFDEDCRTRQHCHPFPLLREIDVALAIRGEVLLLVRSAAA